MSRKLTVHYFGTQRTPIFLVSISLKSTQQILPNSRLEFCKFFFSKILKLFFIQNLGSLEFGILTFSTLYWVFLVFKVWLLLIKSFWTRSNKKSWLSGKFDLLSLTKFHQFLNTKFDKNFFQNKIAKFKTTIL